MNPGPEMERVVAGNFHQGNENLDVLQVSSVVLFRYMDWPLVQ